MRLFYKFKENMSMLVLFRTPSPQKISFSPYKQEQRVLQPLQQKIPEAEASRILHKYVVLIIQQILLLLQLRELQLLLLQ